MPSHQARRAPLPADYQFPTHGVDCDCSTCRSEMPDSEEMRIARMVFAATKLPPIAPDRVREIIQSLGRKEFVPLEPTAETPWGV